MPCFFSCLTTMAGFFALTTSGIVPVRSFGKLMTFGMGGGLIIVFLFLPVLLRLFRPLVVDAASGSTPRSSGLVRVFESVSLAAPRGVLAVSALLFVVSILGALRLSSENKFTHYFRPSSEVFQGLEFIDQNLGGTTPLDIVLTSKQAGFFKRPEGFAALQSVNDFFDKASETGNVQSLLSVREEARKSFPDMKEGQNLSVVGMAAPQFVDQFMSKDGTVARMMIRMKETAPDLHRNRVLGALRAHLDEQAVLKDLHIEVTGIFVLYANMLNSLIESQRDTFLMVVLAIFVMLVILFRNPILAFVVLVPQVLPATVMLGIMGWAGIPLDMVTVMIASIAMGVGVDAAIQYTMRYRQELAIDGDRRAALRRAHATIGRAIWIATSVIVAGFCVLMLSQFFPSVWFGLFTGIAMLMSQFAALTTLRRCSWSRPTGGAGDREEEDVRGELVVYGLACGACPVRSIPSQTAPMPRMRLRAT